MVTVGILAVQGAFIEHKKILDKLGVSSFEIRNKNDLNQSIDALILPGGESTAMYKLLIDLNLFSPLQALIKDGLPVLGTCAGMILLAKIIVDQNQSIFKTMDITVKRNAYGRQLGSFLTRDLFNQKDIQMTFIRAPYIEKTGPDVEILATVQGKIVAARQKNQLVTSFHPELTDDLTVHTYFLSMINQKT